MKNIISITLSVIKWMSVSCLSSLPFIIQAQDCSSIQLSENNSQLIIDGLDAARVNIDVYDPDWKPIPLDCEGINCDGQVLVPNLNPGVHHIIIKLFDARWNKFCDTTLDFMITGINNENQADLSVSNLQNIPATIKIGETKTFKFDLNNFGNGTADGAHQVDIYLSANQNLDFNQYTGGTPFVKVGEVNTGNTPIGTISDVVGAMNVPDGTALGVYYLALIADGTEVISESNETNNVLVSDQSFTLSGSGNTNGGNSIQCGEISINYGSERIAMTGNSGNDYFFKIHDLNANWAEVFSCAYQCGSSQTATDLANGDYIVRVYNNSWEIICEQEINLTGDGGVGEGCGSFEDKFTYQSTSFGVNASFTEENNTYHGCFQISRRAFNQVTYSLDGEKLNTNFVSIDEVSNDFTYTGKDYYYTYTRQNDVVTLNKKNLSGGIIWSKDYILTNSDNRDEATTFDFKETDNGLLLVARYRIALEIDYRQIVIKTDLEGNENWQKEMPLVRNRGIFYIRGIAKDGGAYLIRNLEEVFYLEVIKLNSVGEEQWTKQFTNIFQREDVLFVGEPLNETAVYFYYVKRGQIPVSIIKLNSENGSNLWDKTLPDLFSPNKDIRTSIRRGAVLTKDGGIVASYYYTGIRLSGAEYGKLAANGDFLWRQEVTDIREVAYTPILGTSDGGVLFWDRLVGIRLGVAKVTADGTFDPTCAGNTGGGGTTIECEEITINYDGATINMAGQSDTNYFFKIYDLSDNWKEVYSCAYNCGSSQTATINRNGSYLVRIYNDSWEQICEQEIRLEDAGQRSSRAAVRTFSIFPNPAQEEIAIDLHEHAGETATLTISNLFGQVVQQKYIEKIPDETVKLPLNDFVNGFYFVHIKMKNQRLRSEKFIVKRLY